MGKFGERLKEIRKKENYTQKEVAAAMGINTATVSRYEKGEIIPTEESIYNAAKFLNVSSDYLLGLSDTLNTPDNTPRDYQELKEKAEEFEVFKKKFLQLAKEIQE